MNFAVRKFKNLTPKIPGAPGDYPAEVRGLGVGNSLPTGSGWELMTQAELDQLKADNQTDYNRWRARTSVANKEKHLVKEFNNRNYLVKETWFSDKDSGTGAYINKVREIVYTYSGNSLLSATESVFDSDEAPTVVAVSTYKTETVGTTMKHIEEGS